MTQQYTQFPTARFARELERARLLGSNIILMELKDRLCSPTLLLASLLSMGLPFPIKK
jgi:hypothetical protein